MPHFIAEQIQYPYFPATIMKWNNLDVKLWKSKSLPYFRYALLKVGQPTAKPIYNHSFQTSHQVKTWSQSL